jgi:O-antigen ligase
MSLRVEPKPFNIDWDKVNPYLGTAASSLWEPFLLFTLAAAATLTIWSAEPFIDWIYELTVCLLAAWAVYRNGGVNPAWMALLLWGAAQLAFGATVYRYATLNTSLRMAGLAATAMAASSFLAGRAQRERFLTSAMWFGFAVSVVSVLCYYTSAGRIFWFIPAPYPDVWGPFLSRNNFAQFLELILPVALWRARSSASFLIPAVILAAGLASASRAGAILLLAEALAVFLLRGRRRLVHFFAAAVLLTALAGGQTLLQRLNQPDPQRAEIFRSALAMIAAEPWTGYGLGTFAFVYPEFARFDAGALVEHAHSDWLEWAAEGGIPFALLWAFIAAGALRPAVRSVWGLGVIAVFLHAAVDYPFARTGIAAWAFIFIGALSAGENPAGRAALHQRRTE